MATLILPDEYHYENNSIVKNQNQSITKLQSQTGFLFTTCFGPWTMATNKTATLIKQAPQLFYSYQFESIVLNLAILIERFYYHMKWSPDGSGYPSSYPPV